MKYFTTFFLLFMAATFFGQQSIQSKLEGKSDFREIMQTVDQHYQTLEKQGLDRLPGEPSWKRWKRWEWFMSGRLGPNGEMVDIGKHINKAFKAEKKNQPLMRSTNSNWSFIGPQSSSYVPGGGGLNGLGRVDRITFHPTNPNIIFVGTPAGGLWKTANGGNSWTPLTDFLPEMGVSGIVVSHANTNILYILTGDGDGGGFITDFGYRSYSMGVLKSTDGGNTWNETGVLSNDVYVGYRLRQHPTNANILFAATSIGIFKTTNGGATWTSVSNSRTYDIEFKPGDGSTLYASIQGGLKFSTDTGDSWSTAVTNEPICCNGRVEIAVTPANPNLVYLLAGPSTDTAEFNGIFLSSDSGENFIRTSNTPNVLGRNSDGSSIGDQSFYDLGIAASPTNQNLIVTVGLNAWRSFSAGIIFQNITTYGEDPNESWYVHPDLHDVAYNPLDGNLYIAGDGGFYKSTDNGANWTDLSAGINTTQSYHMRGSSANVNAIALGNQDNGVKLRSSNTSDFPHATGGDGFDVAFVSGDATKFYATINQGLRFFWNSGGSSANRSPSLGWFKTLATHVTDPNTVFVGSDTIFRSSDQGITWDTLPGAKGTWSITTCPSNQNKVYCAGAGSYANSGAGKVYWSGNLGNDWTIISDNTGFPQTFTKVTDLGVHPTQSAQIWAAMGGFDEGVKVYRSTNNGNAWTNLSGSLPNVPINCISIDSDGTAYVGTDIGIYFRSTANSDWVPYSNNLPVVPVTDIEIYNSFIRASTFGRGVWQSDKPNTCSIALLLNGTLTGDKYYETSLSIVTDATIQGGVGTNIALKAGNYVRFDPGFEAKVGNVARAYIGPCPE